MADAPDHRAAYVTEPTTTAAALQLDAVAVGAESVNAINMDIVATPTTRIRTRATPLSYRAATGAGEIAAAEVTAVSVVAVTCCRAGPVYIRSVLSTNAADGSTTSASGARLFAEKKVSAAVQMLQRPWEVTRQERLDQQSETLASAELLRVEGPLAELLWYMLE
ncbi:hypothetical protein Q7P35_010669 [Cladosporium inversicolor]